MGYLEGQDAMKIGLGNAFEQMQTETAQMPQYVSSASVKPATADYYSYTPTTPMASISTPNYQLNAGNAPEYKGLMAGDYDALQKALYQPAQSAAQNAYEQGYNRLNNAMGGQGLYGSSIMAQNANQNLDRTLQNTLATAAAQAAAQRYGMQQQDLGSQNQFNSNLYNAALQREANMNQYAGNMASLNMNQASNQWKALNDINQQTNAYNAAKQAYNLQQAQRMIDWQNQQAYEKYAYDQAMANYANNMRTQRINEQLALSQAGYGAWKNTLANTQMENYQDALKAQQNMGLAQGIGGLLSSGTGTSLLNAAIKGLGGLLGSEGTSYEDNYPSIGDYGDVDWTYDYGDLDWGDVGAEYDSY